MFCGLWALYNALHSCKADQLLNATSSGDHIAGLVVLHVCGLETASFICPPIAMYVHTIHTCMQ